MSVTYLRCYIVGCVPLFAYNALNGVYTALGDSKTPLRFLIISSVLNVALDLILLMGFKRGVVAAALDTAFAQAVAAVLAFVDIPKLLSGFRRDKKEPLFDGKLMGTMLKFAVPSALQQSIVTVGSVVVQATSMGSEQRSLPVAQPQAERWIWQRPSLSITDLLCPAMLDKTLAQRNAKESVPGFWAPFSPAVSFHLR